VLVWFAGGSYLAVICVFDKGEFGACLMYASANTRHGPAHVNFRQNHEDIIVFSEFSESLRLAFLFSLFFLSGTRWMHGFRVGTPPKKCNSTHRQNVFMDIESGRISPGTAHHHCRRVRLYRREYDPWVSASTAYGKSCGSESFHTGYQ
jgi:hypothetical protein